MAITSSVDGSRQFAALTIDGACDFAALRSGILEFARPPARRRDAPDGIPILIDFRGTPFVPTAIEALELADVMARPGSLLDHRVALVAAEETQLRIVSVIAALCSLRGAEARSFRDFEAARGWLRARAPLFSGPSPMPPHGPLDDAVD